MLTRVQKLRNSLAT